MSACSCSGAKDPRAKGQRSELYMLIRVKISSVTSFHYITQTQPYPISSNRYSVGLPNGVHEHCGPLSTAILAILNANRTHDDGRPAWATSTK